MLDCCCRNEFNAYYQTDQISGIGWAGNVARMGDRRNAYKVLVGRPEGTEPLGKPTLDGWVILKWISRKRDGEAWTRLP